jgi:hypothetical protein
MSARRGGRSGGRRGGKEGDEDTTPQDQGACYRKTRRVERVSRKYRMQKVAISAGGKMIVRNGSHHGQQQYEPLALGDW